MRYYKVIAIYVDVFESAIFRRGTLCNKTTSRSMGATCAGRAGYYSYCRDVIQGNIICYKKHLTSSVFICYHIIYKRIGVLLYGKKRKSGIKK